MHGAIRAHVIPTSLSPWFGEEALFDRSAVRSGTAVCAHDSKLLHVPAAHFARFLEILPRVEDVFRSGMKPSKQRTEATARDDVLRRNPRRPCAKAVQGLLEQQAVIRSQVAVSHHEFFAAGIPRAILPVMPKATAFSG